MFINSIFTLVFILGFMTACSDIRLSPVGDENSNAQSKGDFCTYDPFDTISYTNYLFIVDFSGSNGTTDRRKERIKKIRKFYDEKKNEQFTRFGAISFDTSSQGEIYETNKEEPIFTDDLAVSEEGIRRMETSGNRSSTNYSGAIDMAAEMIQKDVELNRRDDFYMIFFLTDGEPNVGVTSESGLVQKVKDLVGIRDGRIFFSAAYYGGIGDPGKLRKMAEAGKGNFVDINNAQDLNFADLVVGPKRESWLLKKDAFFVYNLNSAICFEGKSAGYYNVDSDGDGLCDHDELANGFNPTLRSTPQLNPKTGQMEDKGYSDYFIYFEKKGILFLPQCKLEDRIDEDKDLLNNCEERITKNDSPHGTKWKDVEWLTTNPLDPDTDNDGIIDGIEAFTLGKKFALALDSRSENMLDDEGLTQFRQTQLHKNPVGNDYGSIPYDFVIKEIGTENGKTCYDYKQSRLELYNGVQDTNPSNAHPELIRESGKNVVLIYFMQTKLTDPNGKGIYMHSFQELETDPNYLNAHGPLGGLKVKSSVFTPYETYKKLEE